jgi:hypothetical protein
MLKESSIHQATNMHARKAAAHLLLAYSFVEAAVAGEDADERHHDVTDDSAELIIRLLEEPVAAHAEGDLLHMYVVSKYLCR